MSGASRLVPAVVLVGWRQCAEGLRDVKLERVDTDWRIRFTWVALNERDRVLQCLEAAGRDSLGPNGFAATSPQSGRVI